MNIAQIRAAYPQYNDLSDKQLADALHQKFYSDIPIHDYYAQIGFTPERSWGEVATDVPASLLSGIGSLAKVPGQLVGLIPGARRAGEIMMAPGEAISGYGTDLKSAGLKTREAIRSNKLSEAEKDGVVAEFATAIKSTITDPALLVSFVTEQLPQLVGPAGAAKVVKLIGPSKEALKIGATQEVKALAAKQLGERATAAAVGTGAVMQGADVGDDTYRAVYALARKQGLSEEDANKLAGEKARTAAFEAAAISLATNRGLGKFGGQAIERKLAGLPGQGRIRSGLGEALSESLEEAGGAYAKGVGMAEVDPSISPITGVGTAAGLGAIGGGTLGAILGAHGERGREAQKSPTTPSAGGVPPIEEAIARKEAAEVPPPVAPTAEVPPPVAPTAEVPPIEEPKVKKTGEPPATGLQPDEVAELGVTKKQPIFRRMLGKDMTDPAQRDAVLADIENYLTRGNGSEESRTKLAAFKEQFAPPVTEAPAAPTAETSTAPTAAPTAETSTAPTATPTAATETKTAAAPTTTPTTATETKTAAAPTTTPTTATETKTAEPVTTPTTEAPRVESTKPETGGAGVSVAGEPSAGAATEGTRAAESSGVVPTVTDAGKPTGRKGPAPTSVKQPPAEPSAMGTITKDIEKVKPQYSEADEAALIETRDALKKYISDLKEGQKGLKTRGGKVLPGDRPAYEDAQKQINYLQEEQNAIEEQLAALRKTKPGKQKQAEPVKASDRGINYYPHKEEAFSELERQIIQAVGAYNNPKSDATRRRLSTDYIFDLAKDKTAPEAARKMALRALKNAVDPRDLRDHQRDDYVSLTKDVPEDETAWGGYRYTKLKATLKKQAYPEITTEESKKIESDVRGKTVPELAAYMASYFKVGDQKLIAQRVFQRLKIMAQLGVNFEFKLIGQGDPAPSAIAYGVASGMVNYNTREGNINITLYLRSAEMDNSGINPRIMLHELLHAATIAAIHVGNRVGAKGSNAARMSAELITLHNAFIKHFNQRVADYKAGKIELNEIEEAIYNKNINAGTDPHELLTWGLTSPNFQSYLESIPHKGSNIWTQFVDAIRTFLGMAPRTDTILSELLRTSEELLNADPSEEMALVRRIYGPSGSGTVSTPAITGASTTAASSIDIIGDRKENTVVDRLRRDLADNPALRLRVKLTDSYAALDDLFAYAYNGVTRIASGRINPMVLISRAIDALRVAKAVHETGGLSRIDGLIVASKLVVDGREISYNNVIKRIADAARTAGTSYEAYRKVIDNVLYAHREYNLRRENEAIEQQAMALDAAGKSAEAATLRSNKITLALNPTQIQEGENAFQQDSFIKQVSEDLDAIRFNLIDMLVDTGRLSEENGQDYKDATGYIPFERIGDYDNKYQDTSRGKNRGVAASKKMYAMEGSSRKSTSVVENFSKLVDWATSEAMKTEATSRAIEDMLLLNAAKAGDRPQEDSPGGTIDVYKDGVRTKYYIPDTGHLAAFSMIPPQLSKATHVMRYFSKALRFGVTAFPPFAVKQVMDDIQRAYVYAGVKDNPALVKNILSNLPKLWFQEVFKHKSESIKELERLGIVATYDVTHSSNLKNILTETGAKEEGLGSAIARVMEAGAKASDLAVRQAIYEQVKKETRSAQFPDGDTAAAESAAREIINFSRRGSAKFMDSMISTIPFFNAYARGMDKLLVAGAGKYAGRSVGIRRNMFYKRMSVMVGLGFAYALMMVGDDEYEKLDDHTRDTNWVLPYGKFLGYTPSISIPSELGFIFKSIPERIVRYFKYQGTPEERAAIDLLGGLARHGLNVYGTPNIISQMVRPVVENITNYSWYLGRPLESQAQEQQRPFMRHGAGTSDAMKIVASALESAANATGTDVFAVSPIKLENAVRGIFGTLGGVTLSVFDALINPSRTDRPLHQQLATQVTGASAFMKSPIGTTYKTELYDLDKRTTQVNNTFNSLVQSDSAKAEQYIADNIGMFTIHDTVKGLMDTVHELDAIAKLVDENKTMSPKERRKKIDELHESQNDLARQVFALRKQARNIQLGMKP